MGTQFTGSLTRERRYLSRQDLSRHQLGIL